MVRVKSVKDAEKQAELKKTIGALKEKFEDDKRELEKAKRKFSAQYVAEVVRLLKEALPENILNMRALDFVKLVQSLGDNDEPQPEIQPMDINNMQTPVQSRRKFTSITTPSGMAMQIPSMITPRVDGAVLRSRTSRHGEVLFSVNGTPVITEEDRGNTTIEQAKTVQELLRKEESEMSPATRKIVQQLRAVIAKKAATPPPDELLLHTSETSDDN